MHLDRLVFTIFPWRLSRTESYERLLYCVEPLVKTYLLTGFCWPEAAIGEFALQLIS